VTTAPNDGALRLLLTHCRGLQLHRWVSVQHATYHYFPAEAQQHHSRLVCRWEVEKWSTTANVFFFAPSRGHARCTTSKKCEGPCKRS